jgi:hypothetical protein
MNLKQQKKKFGGALGQAEHQGYDHVVLLLSLIKLDYNLTSTSWPSSWPQVAGGLTVPF